MSKRFGGWVQPVKILATADPYHAGVILKKGINVRAAQTVRLGRIRSKNLEPIAVVSIQAVLRPEPYESPIILHNLRDACLRQSCVRGKALKSKICAVGYSHSNRRGIQMHLFQLRRATLILAPRIRSPSTDNDEGHQ